MSWTVPEELAIEGIESRWIERWERDGTYRFSGDRPRSEVYSIDTPPPTACLLYTSDAADERSSVDLGGRRIIKKKNNQNSCA